MQQCRGFATSESLKLCTTILGLVSLVNWESLCCWWILLLPPMSESSLWGRKWPHGRDSPQLRNIICSAFSPSTIRWGLLSNFPFSLFTVLDKRFPAFAFDLVKSDHATENGWWVWWRILSLSVRSDLSGQINLRSSLQDSNPPPTKSRMMLVVYAACQDVTNVTNQGNAVRRRDSMWQMWQMQSRASGPRVRWWATWTLWWAAWWWRHATLTLWQRISPILPQ